MRFPAAISDERTIAFSDGLIRGQFSDFIATAAVALRGGPRAAAGQPAGKGARVGKESEEHGGLARAGEEGGQGVRRTREAGRCWQT